jgi:hypothetical protein
MTICDYQILEYSPSETRTQGIPLILILRLHVLDSYQVTSYILRDWEKKIGAAAEGELEDVEILLKDLQHHSRKENYVATFFDRLSRLSVGPIRAFVSGSSSMDDLEEVTRVFFEKPDKTSPWRDSFEEI